MEIDIKMIHAWCQTFFNLKVSWCCFSWFPVTESEITWYERKQRAKRTKLSGPQTATNETTRQIFFEEGLVMKIKRICFREIKESGLSSVFILGKMLDRYMVDVRPLAHFTSGFEQWIGDARLTACHSFQWETIPYIIKYANIKWDGKSIHNTQ